MMWQKYAFTNLHNGSNQTKNGKRNIKQKLQKSTKIKFK